MLILGSDQCKVENQNLGYTFKYQQASYHKS